MLLAKKVYTKILPRLIDLIRCMVTTLARTFQKKCPPEYGGQKYYFLERE